VAAPNTHREALIAELLGDVGTMLDRADELQAAFPVAAEAAAGKVRVAGELAAGGVTAAGERFLAVFDQRTGTVLQGVQEAAREAQEAARVVDRAAWHFALLAGAVGLAAGALGGILAGLAIGRGLISGLPGG
jgi:hypothetical protein